jgi:hypothetical protein
MLLCLQRTDATDHHFFQQCELSLQAIRPADAAYLKARPVFIKIREWTVQAWINQAAR